MSEEIQERVRNAALKLGIDLNEKLKTKIIAFILSNRGVLHPFHFRVLTGAEAYCAEQGYDLLLILSYRYEPNVAWKDIHLPQAVQSRNIVRGAILAGTNSPNLLASLAHKGLPFSVLGNNVTGQWEPEKHDVVWSDDVQGSYEMTRRLQSLGHRDIWFVANRQFPWFARCGEGYLRAMTEAHLPPRFGEIHSDVAEEVGYLSTKTILNDAEPLSAVLAGSDETARGVYKALMESGQHIPDDVSVASVGDLESVLARPQLTTVREFPEQLGRHLAEMVISRIGRTDLPPRQITIPTQVINRESTGRCFDRSRTVIPA